MTDDNVTPITPSHVCASCKATIDTRDVYEGHGPTCMQPEVRIRRLERQVVELKDAHNHLVDVVTRLIGERDELQTSLLALARHLLTPGECLQPDGGMACGGCDLCPNCSTSGQFHGTCGINETLISLLNEEAGRKKHGTSESPDTQRSDEPILSTDGLRPLHAADAYFCRLPPYPGGPLTNPGPAEPERSPAAGADAAGEEPGRT